MIPSACSASNNDKGVEFALIFLMNTCALLAIFCEGEKFHLNKKD